jgi:hypothetical protein
MVLFPQPLFLLYTEIVLITVVTVMPELGTNAVETVVYAP